MSLSFTINENFEFLTKDQIHPLIANVLAKWLAYTKGDMVTLHLSGPNTSAPGSPTTLRRRTGHLARNWTTNVKDNGSEIVGTMATKEIYAFTQEFGAVIKPKKGKFLTIPIGKSLTPAGAWKGKTVRDIKKPVWSKNAVGQKNSKTKEIDWLFLLVKSVTIPPRPYAKPSLERNVQRLLKDLKRINPGKKKATK